MKFQGELMDEKEKSVNFVERKIAFVPQSTLYLDPLMKVGKQVCGKKREKGVRKAIGIVPQVWSAWENRNEISFRVFWRNEPEEFCCLTALMENPKLIIADEPTPGMDLTLAKSLWRIQKICRWRKWRFFWLLMILSWHWKLLTGSLFFMQENSGRGPVSDFVQKRPCVILITKAFVASTSTEWLNPSWRNPALCERHAAGMSFGPRCSWYREECTGEIPMVEDGCGSVRCIRYCM